MKLNRNFNQRKALRRTQLTSLINFGKITTTEAKAKEVKRLFDRLVGKAKEISVHIRRLLAAELASTKSANRLVDVIAPLFPDKKSGFTTSFKEKIRKGDGVTMVSIKLLADLPKPQPKPIPTPAPVKKAKKQPK
ncbi:50S ribosomal protein L17 [Candidatus Collierbacteria bacterium]|nr:50S ribosomal protein L17 [Candidatus Collierbacteria bacterium]